MKSDYAKIKQIYFGEDVKCKDVESEKQIKKSEELFIKSEVKNPVLKEFLNRLEEEYGCLLTNSGTVVKVDENYKWFSVKTVTVMVSELDKELRENERVLSH